MTDTYDVAIMGATGAVGQVMMEILAERNFPIGKLRLLASARSAGVSSTPGRRGRRTPSGPDTSVYPAARALAANRSARSSISVPSGCRGWRC